MQSLHKVALGALCSSWLESVVGVLDVWVAPRCPCSPTSAVVSGAWLAGWSRKGYVGVTCTQIKQLFCAAFKDLSCQKDIFPFFIRKQPSVSFADKGLIGVSHLGSRFDQLWL